jgi:hypothetical protein
MSTQKKELLIDRIMAIVDGSKLDSLTLNKNNIREFFQNLAAAPPKLRWQVLMVIIAIGMQTSTQETELIDRITAIVDGSKLDSLTLNKSDIREVFQNLAAAPPKLQWQMLIAIEDLSLWDQ